MNKKEPLIDLLIHDLTGPISVVFTSVKHLLDKSEKYGTSERQREILERILRNSHKAKTILQELVEVYRSEEGRFCKESLPMKDLLREAFLDAFEIINPQKAEHLLCFPSNDTFLEALNADDIDVELSGRYRDAPFLHDYRKIRQITRNLISNALKHRKKQMLVSVSGDRDIVISVKDDGHGMSAKEQGAVFSRFADLEDKTVTNAEGLGFGLSCVKILVEAVGGEITVKSGEGAGTCFTVRIPPLSETQS